MKARSGALVPLVAAALTLARACSKPPAPATPSPVAADSAARAAARRDSLAAQVRRDSLAAAARRDSLAAAARADSVARAARERARADSVRAQVARAHFEDADHEGAIRVGEVVGFVQNRLRRVFVRVNDDGAFEHSAGHFLSLRARALRRKEECRDNRESKKSGNNAAA